MKKILISLMIIMLTASSTFAASKVLRVSWTCNTETDLAGYTAWTYIGATSTTPHTTTDVPYVTGMTCQKDLPVTVPDNARTVVCVDLDAYDTSGNHSAHSAKICTTIDLQAPAAPTNLIITVQ